MSVFIALGISMGSGVCSFTSATVPVRIPGSRATEARAAASIGGTLAPEHCLFLAERGARRGVLPVFLAESVPIGGGANLAQDGEDQSLHAPDQQRLGRERLAAHLLEVLRARRGARFDRLGHVGRGEPADARLEVP